MCRTAVMTAAAGMVLGLATASAQPADRRAAEQMYEIRQLERVLEGAVEHGASIMRERLRSVVPTADMLLSAVTRARGYRLDGYGVFFHVEVPALQGTLPWSFALLERNNLGLDSALNDLRQAIAKMNDAALEQALSRIELQVTPFALAARGRIGGGVDAAAPAETRALAGLAAAAGAPADTPADPVLDDPVEAYRAEIRGALMGAMLEHSRGLGLEASEVLTVAARGSEDVPRLGLTDGSLRVTQITVKGTDLAAFFAGKISGDEARRRMVVRVF